MSKRDNPLNQYSKIIEAHLLKHGIVLHKYKAYKTNSIYLKLDFGVANSIRISDHRGYDRLKYRYNLCVHEAEYFEEEIKDSKFTYIKKYFPLSMLDEMIEEIVQARKDKIRQYGMQAYLTFMERDEEKSKNSKGFWQQCYKVREVKK